MFNFVFQLMSFFSYSFLPIIVYIFLFGETKYIHVALVILFIFVIPE